MVLASGGEVVGGVWEGLHAAAVGREGRAEGRVCGGEGVLAAAEGGSHFSPHEGSRDRTHRGEEDKEGTKGVGKPRGGEPT